MNAYITAIEVYTDCDTLVGKIESFDELSYTVKIDTVATSDELRYMADVLERLEKDGEFHVDKKAADKVEA